VNIGFGAHEIGKGETPIIQVNSPIFTPVSPAGSELVPDFWYHGTIKVPLMVPS